jgi:hypothetical protein
MPEFWFSTTKNKDKSTLMRSKQRLAPSVVLCLERCCKGLLFSQAPCLSLSLKQSTSCLLAPSLSRKLAVTRLRISESHDVVEKVIQYDTTIFGRRASQRIKARWLESATIGSFDRFLLSCLFFDCLLLIYGISFDDSWSLFGLWRSCFLRSCTISSVNPLLVISLRLTCAFLC